MSLELVNKEEFNTPDVAVPEIPLAFLEDDEVDYDNYTKLPLTELKTLGAGFDAIVSAVQAVWTGRAGKSGLYMVTIPGGGELAQFKDKTAYLGSVLTKEGAVGGGQARLTKVPIDPAAVFMIAALMNIEKKLDEIQETQKEILEFLEQQEKAKLQGNLVFLMDIVNGFKYNWNNQQYKNSVLGRALKIRNESDQSIIFAKSLIEKRIKKKKLIHGDQDVKRQMKKIQSEFSDYQLAVYLYALSSFVEVILLDNYDADYLNAVAQKIENYEHQYRKLYTASFNVLDKAARETWQTLIMKGAGKVARGAGKGIEKAPVIGKAFFDEALIAAGSGLSKLVKDKNQKVMAQLIPKQSSYVAPLVENIRMLDQLYSKQLELAFDKENLYLAG